MSSIDDYNRRLQEAEEKAKRREEEEAGRKAESEISYAAYERSSKLRRRIERLLIAVIFLVVVAVAFFVGTKYFKRTPISLGADTRKIKDKVSDEFRGSQKGASAIVGYSYPLKLKRNTEGYVNAFVSVLQQGDAVVDSLLSLVKLQGKVTENNDTVILYNKNVMAYDDISVELIDDSHTFLVVPHQDTGSKPIDKRYGNAWTWAISTSTDREKAVLTLKIRAKTPSGKGDYWKEAYISIVIELDTDTFFRKALAYYSDHPALIFGSIGTLLVGIFAWLWKRGFKSKEKEGGSDPKDAGPPSLPPGKNGEVRDDAIPVLESSAPAGEKPAEASFTIGDTVCHKFSRQEMQVEGFLKSGKIRCSWQEEGKGKCFADLSQDDLEVV